MPRPTYHERSEEYKFVSARTSIHNEAADCAVKAVAIACNVSYNTALERLAEKGRQPRKGTHTFVITAAIESFGFGVRRMDDSEFIARYPRPHNTLRSITTHHPDRFPSVWKDGKTYLFFPRGHVLCVKDGINHDYTRGHAQRVSFVYEVVPSTPLEFEARRQVVEAMRNADYGSYRNLHYRAQWV